MRIARPAAAMGLVACAVLAGVPVHAAPGCSACTDVPSLDLSLDLSAGYQSDDSFKYGDYTGLDRAGAVGMLDVAVVRRDDEGIEWRLDAADLGLDSRSLSLGVRRPGLLDVQLDHDALPHLLFDRVATPFDPPGGAVQVLPPDWVPGATTGAMPALGDSLGPAAIRTDRKTFGAGLVSTPASRWRFDLAARLDQKDGTTLGGGAFLFQDAILVQPVDLETRIFEAGAAYAAPDWGARLGYYGSRLTNDSPTLAFDNPYALTPARGERALEPDNEFNQLTLSGNWRHGRLASLTGDIALGRGRQDQSLLPFSTVATRGGPLPRAQADASVETLHAAVRLVANPAPRLRFQADWLRDERDNDTPVADWDYVVTDIGNGAPRPNLGYDVARERWRAEAEWRAGGGIRAAAGWGSERVDRDYREVPTTTEDGYWLRVNAPVASIGSVGLRWRSAARRGSGSSERPGFLVAEDPLLTRTDVARRDRRAVEATLALQPLAWLDVTLSGEKGTDDYDATVVGLQRADYDRVSADGTLRFGTFAQLTAFLSREESGSRQGGSTGAAEAGWHANQDDDTEIAGLSLGVTLVPDRLTASAGMTRVRTGSLVVMERDGNAEPFPDLDTDLDRAEVALRWVVTRPLRLRLTWVREDYAVDDWALDGVFVDTLPQLLAVGASRPDYDVDLVLLAFEYDLPRR